jgi:hypothetical protein
MQSNQSTVYSLDPLSDRRWSEFLSRNPYANVFHTAGWLRALQSTYGYKPIVFTTSAPNSELSNGVAFCEVKSWLTGSRMVSLPFSDHCQPLADADELRAILDSLKSQVGRRWKYLELRPRPDQGAINLCAGLGKSEKFSFHAIDLKPPTETIYRQFHDSCIRRKIKKADKEKLTYEAGRSEHLLKQFRHLLLLTRRRHKLPPQPQQWFRNVVHHLGEQATIHVLSKDANPVASIITLQHGKSLIYKYGCSDAQYHSLGGMPLLFWKVIQDAKQSGVEDFDLGRSGSEDPGLIAF